MQAKAARGGRVVCAVWFRWRKRLTGRPVGAVGAYVVRLRTRRPRRRDASTGPSYSSFQQKKILRTTNVPTVSPATRSQANIQYMSRLPQQRRDIVCFGYSATLFLQHLSSARPGMFLSHFVNGSLIFNLTMGFVCFQFGGCSNTTTLAPRKKNIIGASSLYF